MSKHPMLLCVAFAALAISAASACDKLPDTSGDSGGASDQAASDTSDAGDLGDTGDTAAPLTAAQQQVLGVGESGRITLPGLRAPVHVLFTEANVPHVYAASREDLGLALGFVVARDRFFVMDLERRAAQGRLGELVGELALPSDLEGRMTGMADVTDRLVAHLDPADAAYIDAYAAGINAYIEAVRRREANPPSEFKSLGILLGSTRPAELMAPFDRRDVLAIATIAIYQTNFDGSDVARHARAEALPGLFEGVELSALRKAGALHDLWERIATPFDYASTPGWGRHEKGRTPASLRSPVAPRAPHGEPLLLWRAERRLANLHRRLGRSEAANAGSNTWTVHPSRTRDGAALVAGDGHLPLSAPPLMYQVGLDTEVFGGGDIHQSGLLILGAPLLAVGTNGQVAWSQVNPVSDITDWYLEELQLGADGLPAASLFAEAWRALERVDESYTLARVPALGSPGGVALWPRWRTFDGRYLFDVEGREVALADVPDGTAVVALPGAFVVPEDLDGDGKIQGVSLDYTAFDATAYIKTVGDFGHARDVYEFQDTTRGLIGNMLSSAVADQQGNIFFSAYQAVPCRGYLPKDANGWEPGADPTQLLDGRRFGGFTIPSDAAGRVDEGPGATDPYRCVVPFDATPQIINPDAGFVVNANNQPAPITDDDSLTNDPWYIGGPWASVRADSIARGLEAAIAAGGADVASMARLQAETRSRLGELFVGDLLGALDAARAWDATEGPLEPHQARALALYDANRAAFDEAYVRLTAWRDTGFGTDSGVETFYHVPTASQLEDSVATMIFNAWLPRALDATFADENMDAAWHFDEERARWYALLRFLDGRGLDNPAGLASWNEDTGESVFFDVLGTPPVEHSEEVLLSALVDTLAFLASAPTGPGEGGFGSAEMATWLWGLRHQVRFESLLAELGSDPALAGVADAFSITTDVLPLAPSLSQDDPRFGLKWFPRPGDSYAVDVASPGFSGTRFTYGHGPAMRVVIALKDGRVWGQNIVPGGQSGLKDSPFFADQAAKWLANETIPLWFHVEEVAGHATGREVFLPAAP